MGLDYYRVLFLKRTATQDEIKQAYKKMALLHHPMSRKVERPTSPSIRAREHAVREQKRQIAWNEVFYLVAEAYDVLGDPQRRAIYDLYGDAGLKEGIPGPDGFISPYGFHGDPHRTFREFFRTDNPFVDLLVSACVPIDMFVGGDNLAFSSKEPPVTRDIYLDLDEIYMGCLKKVMISKKTIVGENGETEIREKVLTLPIQPGTPDKARFSFANEGDQHGNVNREPADVIFVVQTKEHPVYTRDGDNLIMYKKVNLCQAITGLIIPIETLDKRKFNVNVIHLIKPGYEHVVEGEGFPIYQESGKKGNLIIRFSIKYPKTLTQVQKKMAKEALDCNNENEGARKSSYKKRPAATETLPDGSSEMCICPCPSEIKGRMQ